MTFLLTALDNLEQTRKNKEQRLRERIRDAILDIQKDFSPKIAGYNYIKNTLIIAADVAMKTK